MAESPTSNSPSHEPLHPLSPATPSTPAAAPTLDSRVHLSEDAPASPADADASAGKEEEEKNRAEEALQQDGLDESRTAMASEGYPPGVNPGTEASSPQEEVGAESTAASAPARKERKKNERGAARDARKERKSAALAALRTPAAQAAAPSPSPSTTSLAGDAAPPTAAVDVNSSSPSRPPTPPSPSRTANTFPPANPPAPSVSKGSTASSDAPAPAEDPPSPIASVDPVAQAKPAAHTPAPSAPTPAPAASFAAAAASTASAAPTARAALAKGQTTRLGGSLPAKRPPLGSRSTAPAQARAAKGASSPGVKVGGARGAKKRTGGMKPRVWVPDGRVVVGNQSFEPNSGEAVNIVMPLRHSCGANSKPAERLLNTYRPPSSPPRSIKRPKLRTLRPNPRIPPTTEAVSRARGSDNPQRSSRTPAPPPRIAPSTLTSSAPAQFYKKKKKPAHTRQHKLRAGNGGCSASGMSGAKGAPRGPGASQSPSRAGEQEDRAGETVPKAAAQGSSGEAQRRAATNGVKTVKRGQDCSGGAARAKKVENAHTGSPSSARTKGPQARPGSPAAPPSPRQQRIDDGARAPHAPTKPVVASDEPVATDQPDSPSPTATAAPDTTDPRVAPPVTGNLSLPTVPSRAEEATPPPPPGSAEPAGSSTEAQQSATPPPPQPAPAPPSTREEMLEHTVEVVAAKLAKDAARRGPRRWWHAVGRSRASPQSRAYARRVRTLRALERAQVFEWWRDAMKKKVEEDEQAEREWARRRRSAMSGRVTVTHGARRIATLTHHDDMTTATLKVEVRRTTGIPLSKQHIFYEGNELRNAHTLARARVPPGAVLRLEAPPAPLLAVDRGGQQVKLAVESSAVVDDIGTALSRYCAPLGAYPLSLGGKTLLGGRSIASFGYGPRNVVKIAGTFLPSFPLPVTLASGDKITLVVNTFDSVEVIKSKIGAKTGVQPRQLDLFIGDIKLDEKKSVADVGLNAKSNVGVVQHNLLQIYIKNLAGKLIPVEIDSGDTVTDVKAIIEEKEGVPRAEQRLIYAGHQLEDSTALATFDFPPGATLDLVLRLRGGARVHFLPRGSHREAIGDGRCFFDTLALSLDVCGARRELEQENAPAAPPLPTPTGPGELGWGANYLRKKVADLIPILHPTLSHFESGAVEGEDLIAPGKFLSTLIHCLDKSSGGRSVFKDVECESVEAVAAALSQERTWADFNVGRAAATYLQRDIYVYNIGTPANPEGGKEDCCELAERGLCEIYVFRAVPAAQVVRLACQRSDASTDVGDLLAPPIPSAPPIALFYSHIVGAGHFTPSIPCLFFELERPDNRDLFNEDATLRAFPHSNRVMLLSRQVTFGDEDEPDMADKEDIANLVAQLDSESVACRAGATSAEQDVVDTVDSMEDDVDATDRVFLQHALQASAVDLVGDDKCEQDVEGEGEEEEEEGEDVDSDEEGEEREEREEDEGREEGEEPEEGEEGQGGAGEPAAAGHPASASLPSGEWPVMRADTSAWVEPTWAWLGLDDLDKKSKSATGESGVNKRLDYMKQNKVARPPPLNVYEFFGVAAGTPPLDRVDIAGPGVRLPPHPNIVDNASGEQIFVSSRLKHLPEFQRLGGVHYQAPSFTDATGFDSLSSVFHHSLRFIWFLYQPGPWICDFLVSPVMLDAALQPGFFGTLFVPEVYLARTTAYVRHARRIMRERCIQNGVPDAERPRLKVVGIWGSGMGTLHSKAVVAVSRDKSTIMSLIGSNNGSDNGGTRGTDIDGKAARTASIESEAVELLVSGSVEADESLLKLEQLLTHLRGEARLIDLEPELQAPRQDGSSTYTARYEDLVPPGYQLPRLTLSTRRGRGGREPDEAEHNKLVAAGTKGGTTSAVSQKLMRANLSKLLAPDGLTARLCKSITGGTENVYISLFRTSAYLAFPAIRDGRTPLPAQHKSTSASLKAWNVDIPKAGLEGLIVKVIDEKGVFHMKFSFGSWSYSLAEGSLWSKDSSPFRAASHKELLDVIDKTKQLAAGQSHISPWLARLALVPPRSGVSSRCARADSSQAPEAPGKRRCWWCCAREEGSSPHRQGDGRARGHLPAAQLPRLRRGAEARRQVRPEAQDHLSLVPRASQAGQEQAEGYDGAGPGGGVVVVRRRLW